jgi:hypothetical protein
MVYAVSGCGLGTNDFPRFPLQQILTTYNTVGTSHTSSVTRSFFAGKQRADRAVLLQRRVQGLLLFSPGLPVRVSLPVRENRVFSRTAGVWRGAFGVQPHRRATTTALYRLSAADAAEPCEIAHAYVRLFSGQYSWCPQCVGFSFPVFALFLI